MVENTQRPQQEYSQLRTLNPHGISYNELVHFVDVTCGGIPNIGSQTVRQVFKKWILPVLTSHPQQSYVDIIHPQLVSEVPIAKSSSVQIKVSDKRELQRNVLIAMSLDDCFVDVYLTLLAYFHYHPFLRHHVLLWMDVFCLHSEMFSYSCSSTKLPFLSENERQRRCFEMLQDHCISTGHCWLIMPSWQHSKCFQSPWVMFLLYLSTLGEFHCEILIPETEQELLRKALLDHVRFPITYGNARYQNILQYLLKGNAISLAAHEERNFIEADEEGEDVRWYESALMVECVVSNEESRARLELYVQEVIEKWIASADRNGNKSVYLEPKVSQPALEDFLAELVHHDLLPNLHRVQMVDVMKIEEYLQRHDDDKEGITYLLQQLIVGGADASTSSAAASRIWLIADKLIQKLNSLPDTLSGSATELVKATYDLLNKSLPCADEAPVNSNSTAALRSKKKVEKTNSFLLQLHMVQNHRKPQQQSQGVAIIITEQLMHQIVDFFGEQHLVTIQFFYAFSEQYLCRAQVQLACKFAEYSQHLATQYFGESSPNLLFYQTHANHIQLMVNFQQSQQLILATALYHQHGRPSSSPSLTSPSSVDGTEEAASVVHCEAAQVELLPASVSSTSSWEALPQAIPLSTSYPHNHLYQPSRQSQRLRHIELNSEEKQDFSSRCFIM
jgi:hypothetical protein